MISRVYSVIEVVAFFPFPPHQLKKTRAKSSNSIIIKFLKHTLTSTMQYV